MISLPRFRAMVPSGVTSRCRLTVVATTGAAILIAATGFANAQAPAGDPVLAKVDGVEIHQSDLTLAEEDNGQQIPAKDEQGKQEGRILQLQQILENARVGTPPRTEGVVGPGMTVTVRFARDDEEVTFLLASREESGAPIDVYSPKSPLGAAIPRPARCRCARNAA